MSAKKLVLSLVLSVGLFQSGIEAAWAEEDDVGRRPSVTEQEQPSKDDAVIYFQKLWAEREDASALFALGLIYLNGGGVQQDADEALKWFRKAADQGYAEAQLSLGTFYALGEAVQQDYAEAVRWWWKAADQGNAEAQFNLGLCHAFGRGVQQDDIEAANWYRKAAGKGLTKAQFSLGMLYANGKGVEQDHAEAIKWWKKAGDAPSKFRLGLCHFHGKGMRQDRAEAAKLWHEAAEQGLADAQYILGVCYENGQGVPQDPAEAMKWFRKAADQGNDEANRKLGLPITANGKDEDRAFIKAMRQLRKAIDHASEEMPAAYIRAIRRNQELERLAAEYDPNASRSGTTRGDPRNRRQVLTGTARANYMSRVAVCIRPNITIEVSPSIRAGQYRVDYEVKLLPNGELNGRPVKKKASGWDAYDAAVERAIRRCNPFPAPPSGIERPRDLLLSFDPVEDNSRRR